MAHKTYGRELLGFWLKLTLILLVATVFNPTGVLVANSFTNKVPPDFLGLVLSCAVQGAALAWWFLGLRLRSWRLGALVAGMYFLIMVVLLQIETLLFLNVWNPVLSLHQISVIVLNRTLSCILTGLGVALVFRKGRPTFAGGALSFSRGSRLAIRWAMASFVYVPIYLLAGYFVALPLAGNAFSETYGALTGIRSFQMP